MKKETVIIILKKIQIEFLTIQRLHHGCLMTMMKLTSKFLSGLNRIESLLVTCILGGLCKEPMLH